MININLTVKNYKCFDETGLTINNILPINVIIGKNNAGKSSFIDVIRFLTTKDESFFKTLRNNKNPEVYLDYKLNSTLISHCFPKNETSYEFGTNFFHYGMSFLDQTFTYKINSSFENEFVQGEKKIYQSALNNFRNTAKEQVHPLASKIFSHISAERDIKPESYNNTLLLENNGNGATNYIQQIINNTKYNSAIIEDLLLINLNTIINPDINFKRILVQTNDQGNWEIYFDDVNDGRVPLSKMGSGVKTVLLVLLHLLVKPKIENKNKADYIFAFEELENNLHPALQRRLYKYIYDYAQKHKAIFFITTHSNIVIDSYNTLPGTQLFHIQKKDAQSVVVNAKEHSQLKELLADLDIKASDILQSNGIIWVEGPSDRTYINKWISLVDPTLIEGYHYSIMFYGGRLLSNVSFSTTDIEQNLIPLLKLNTNAFVVMDRDGASSRAKINATKDRISQEIGESKVWITRGREIENYLAPGIITKWLQSIDVKNNATIILDANKPIDEILNAIPKLKKINYAANKNYHAFKIANLITNADLDYLDLKPKTELLIQNIKIWNQIIT